MFHFFRISKLMGFLAILAIFTSSCNMPDRRTPTPAGASAIYTAAAQTVQAQMTQVSQPASTSVPSSEAPVSTNTGTSPIDTPPPSTQIVVASPTPAPPKPTSTPLPCDLVKFIQDITFPDNTEVNPGEVFVKTWRLQNAGTCAWTSAYGLVYEGDNVLNSPSFIPITTGSVPPGGIIDISVSLTSPNLVGTYRQNFKLSNAAGQHFALGDGTKPFWAQIMVVAPGGLTFDFLTQADAAEWRSGTGNDLNTLLSFDGADDDASGVAKIKDGVKLETGAISGKILLTFPRHLENGAIAGTYPAYLVQPGDRLRGRIGFLANADGSCGAGRVAFQIYYMVPGSTKLLAEWVKTCNGAFIPIDISLASLAGKNVQFILVARAGSSFQDDWAVWNSLRIER